MAAEGSYLATAPSSWPLPPAPRTHNIPCPQVKVLNGDDEEQENEEQG